MFLAILFGFFAIIIIQSSAMAGNAKAIRFNQLPVSAQTVVNSHFDQKLISLTMSDGFMFKDYDVYFSDGDKIVFNSNGQWTGVECFSSRVPSFFIPKDINNYIEQHYPKNVIQKIEKDHGRTDVKLANGNRDFLQRPFPGNRHRRLSLMRQI